MEGKKKKGLDFRNDYEKAIMSATAFLEGLGEGNWKTKEID